MPFADPRFWRAGAISTVLVMVVVLVMLTADTLSAMSVGGEHVASYSVIDRSIDYQPDANGVYKPVIGGSEPLFGEVHSEQQAADLIHLGKLSIQGHACMDCHTFFGNGAYYAPDLTRAWVDPVWRNMWMPLTQAPTKEEAMARFLMAPDKYVTWSRKMPDLHISRREAVAIVAYLKWLSAVDTNGFPNGFTTK